MYVLKEMIIFVKKNEGTFVKNWCFLGWKMVKS